MEPEAKYAFVGVALLVLVAALVGAMLWLKQTGTRRNSNFYTIYFEHQRLEGLPVGADVNIRGIKVGRVDSYTLDRQDVSRVRATIRVDRHTPVPRSARAAVMRNPLTGTAWIDLEVPHPAGPPLVATAGQHGYPEIPESTSKHDANELVLEALRSVNELLSPENREAVTETLANVRDLSRGVNERLVNVDHALASFDTAAQQIGRAGSRAEVVVGSVGREIVPALRGAQRSMGDISSAAVTVRDQTAVLGPRLGNSLSAATDDFSVLTLELRSTLDALTRVLDRLRDPRAAVFGPNREQRGPGE